VLTPAPAASAHHHRAPHWVPVASGSAQQHRGLDAVDRRTVWAAGTGGEVLRTSDGGRSWRDVSPAGAEALQFRDVEARDSRRASVLAIGEGDQSRIYTTRDGGATWDTAFVNDDPAAFYDCMDFYPDGRHGLAMSDPVDGKFRVIATDDGGRSWHVLPSAGMPEAVAGEFGFAASGTCLVISGHDAWIASGGAASRVFHSRDGGRTWSVVDAPIPAAENGGVFSLAFRNPWQGVMVGGDFLAPDVGTRASGYTRDGGRSWKGGGDLSGYRSGVDWVYGARSTLVAVGPNGSDVTYDGGRSWSRFDDAAYDAVDCVPGTCWATGPAGAIARLGR
jgi:photosystem II stability/assembly factor-like uncharacterized protein